MVGCQRVEGLSTPLRKMRRVVVFEGEEGGMYVQARLTAGEVEIGMLRFSIAMVMVVDAKQHLCRRRERWRACSVLIRT